VRAEEVGESPARHFLALVLVVYDLPGRDAGWHAIEIVLEGWKCGCQKCSEKAIVSNTHYDFIFEHIVLFFNSLLPSYRIN
jgi:hypothetical protein